MQITWSVGDSVTIYCPQGEGGALSHRGKITSLECGFVMVQDAEERHHLFDPDGTLVHSPHLRSTLWRLRK